MARSNEDDALRALKNEVANRSKCETALAAARTKVEKAAVRAVKAVDAVLARGGKPTATRTAVARMIGVGKSHVGSIEGMPPGKNATVKRVPKATRRVAKS